MEEAVKQISLTEKYNITSEYIADLLKHLSLEQIDSLLESIGQAAGDKKSHAYRALPKAVKALEKVKPDTENTVSILMELAETAKEETWLAYETFSEPEAAKALHDVLENGLIWPAPME